MDVQASQVMDAEASQVMDVQVSQVMDVRRVRKTHSLGVRRPADGGHQ